ncbi:DUF4114 domain-containing protein [Dolichospermum sp. UHCC 0259]|uniref:DUF4114 domain-containing protein n=1 Tax=Dolichospermum sp. UHCC 0259 TaxID=2590010 RepID=UPI001447F3B9|nr:DUF4114 domain-containing protein [Dolichospermum sp. UHCC 0259]MTJ46740.1 DUF4114 domain-containing protein [Dolichospermum sp. UHCC 0259]
MATENIKNAYIIGAENFGAWSPGYDASGYLKVLPHPEQKIVFKDPFIQWQQDHQNGQFKEIGDGGGYYSSWGEDEVLEVTLDMQYLSQIDIDGFGIIQAGDGYIPWLNDEKTAYEFLRAYNGLIPGPLLVADPGDTIKITLINNLKPGSVAPSAPEQITNLHTHGLHVSPVGAGDNVVVSLASGDTREISIKLPDNHAIGLDWYHPHLHGITSEQVASGLGGLLTINPPYDLPDLDKFNPTTEPFYTMAINTFGIQQQLRTPNANDPLNQSPDGIEVPAGTPLQLTNGAYELSDAVFGSYNAKPASYDPTQPTGNPEFFLFEYGGGALAEPVENVIHTVNGQYNPTIEKVQTGKWSLFSFANMSINSFHVLQLVHDDGNGNLTPEQVTLVSIDGNASGAVESSRREITEFPVLSPGARVAIQHAFTKPGKYYFLSNGTDEILDADDVSQLIGNSKGFNDGHLIWAPQVLATVEVEGPEITPAQLPHFPEPYDVLIKESEEINATIEAAKNGDVNRERTFTWDANIGGAILAGNFPSDTEVETFEGTYTINGEYYSTTPGESMPPLAMPMLGTKEIWNIVNRSGLLDPNLPQDLNIPLSEWHPFHIHQNDFAVLEINGLKVEDIQQTYLAGVLSDIVTLPPAYVDGTATLDNPYGTPFNIFVNDPTTGVASEVKIVMSFEDFPGSYVNHCHILFHEDAGMMAVLRVILNTEDTWLGLGVDQDAKGQIELFRANNYEESIILNPYGDNFSQGIDLAIADVGYKFNSDEENQNVTDNVTDVITIQRSLKKDSDHFTVKVFDGETLIQEQEGIYEFSAEYELENTFTQIPDTNIFEVLISGTDDSAGYGLTTITGRIYGTIENTGKGTFDSDPTKFGLVGFEEGFIALETVDGERIFGSDTANSQINFQTGVVNASGLVTLSGGEGKFEGIVGRLDLSELGTFNPDPTQPYIADLKVKASFERPETTDSFDGNDPNILLTEITPFQDITPTKEQIASVASGDIDGDGFADIVVGLGGDIAPIIEIYSGKNYHLMSRLNPFHHETFTGKINLAVGDINGDNYDDIIVGQGSGGQGLVEVYDGILIQEKGSLVGKDTAHDTGLLSQIFQPYGTNYTGEVDVTSGYVLQRPDEPNGFPVQTNNANLTTIAKGDQPDGYEQIQVFTYMGGGHGEHHESSSDEEELRLDVSLTPVGNTQEILGTFADLPNLPNGEPVLFTRRKNGEYEIIHLGAENIPESLTFGEAKKQVEEVTEITKVNNKDIFTLKGGSNGKVKLKVTLEEYSSSFVNEIGVFFVDNDEGFINGIAPGTSGYTEAALTRSRVIFSSIANRPNGFSIDGLSSLLEFDFDVKVRFLTINNSTLDAVSSGFTSKTEVLFSEIYQTIESLSGGEFSLKWKDKSDKSSFKLKIKTSTETYIQGTRLQAEFGREVLDFRSSTTDVKAEFKVYREAAFNNFVGFYPILDGDGKIDTNNDGQADFAPGDAGYLQAAVNLYLQEIRLTVTNQGQANYQGTFAQGSIFAPFIIANGTIEDVLNGNSSNIPNVYFAFLGANPGQADHIRLLGNNIFGFEDLPGSQSDNDYNDCIVEIKTA